MKSTEEQSSGYIAVIGSLLNACNFNSYLELGIGYGVCLRHISRACPKVHITAVDLRPRPGYQKDIPTKRVNWKVGITTNDFFAQNEAKFDAVFIDADHNGDQVFADFNNAMRCLNPDGLIFLHDTYPPSEDYTAPSRCSDSFKAYLRLCETPDLLEIVNIPTFCGLTIVRPLTTGRRLLTLPVTMQRRTDAIPIKITPRG
jgi:predicted O-methyltransferase YrrM